MKKNLYLLLCLCLFLTVSCSKEEVEPSFVVKSSKNLTIAADADAKEIIGVTSSQNWKVETSDDWLTVSPSSGRDGTYDVVVTAKSRNTSGATRKATLTFSSESLVQTITVEQLFTDFVDTEQLNYIVPASGGEVIITFTSNLDHDELQIYYDKNSWLEPSPPTRSLYSYELRLTALPNTGKGSRTVQVYFVKEVGQTEIDLGRVTITQQGGAVEQSVDYSADKKFSVIQNASVGKGIPIVIMGDGFIDKDIANGTYERVMNKAYENLFSEEPMKSLRNYFDVYVVNAVSKNNAFGTGNETTFSCKLEGGGSTGISGNGDVVQEYVRAVTNIDVSNTSAVVILNTSEHAGTTYFGYSDAGKVVEFSIAYCPVIRDLESENFRQVLVHEAVGHGFAKLEDEYAYSGNGTMSAKNIAQVKELQKLGWAQNVDFTSKPSEVLWSTFLSDSRYETEGLGVFEGACTYIKGAYRPSKDSMMSSNTTGFNAPSRQSIYDKVMKIGTNTPKTYEEFVTFDMQSGPRTRSVETFIAPIGKPFAHPRFVNKALDEDVSK